MDLFEDVETALKVCEDGWDALFPNAHGMAAVDLTMTGIVVRAGLIVVLFAQFEAEVNRRCEKLIKAKTSASDWRERRAWDSFNPDNVSVIPFLRRLALLLDKNRAEYATARRMYLIRNGVAHGGDMAEEHDFNSVAVALKTVLAAMEENP